MQISVKTNVNEVRKQLKQIPENVINRAATSALNHAIKKAKTHAASTISKEAGIKVGIVKDSLSIYTTNRRSLTATIKAIRTKTNLINFVKSGMRDPKAFAKQKGVKANAWGRNKIYKHTFIVAPKQGGTIVMVRTSKERKPLRPVHGPSIPKVFMQRNINESIVQVAYKSFNERFEKDVKYFMGKYA